MIAELKIERNKNTTVTAEFKETKSTNKRMPTGSATTLSLSVTVKKSLASRNVTAKLIQSTLVDDVHLLKASRRDRLMAISP